MPRKQPQVAKSERGPGFPELREEITAAGLYLYDVADDLEIHESLFSRMILGRRVPVDERDFVRKVKASVKKLAKAQKGNGR